MYRKRVPDHLLTKPTGKHVHDKVMMAAYNGVYKYDPNNAIYTQ